MAFYRGNSPVGNKSAGRIELWALGCETRLWTMGKEHFFLSDVLYNTWTIGAF